MGGLLRGGGRVCFDLRFKPVFFTFSARPKKNGEREKEGEVPKKEQANSFVSSGLDNNISLESKVKLMRSLVI